METLRRTFVASIVLLLGLWLPASAQIPGPSASARIDVAEVRGLDAVPSNAESEFASAAPGPVFELTVQAVLVRFQAATAPKDSGLAVTWAATPDSGGSQQLGRVAVESGRLVSGITETLTDGGKPLAKGRYAVSLVGANNRYYRTVEFWVGPRPERSRGGREKVYFDQYSFEYPKTYTPAPVTVGMTGVFLIRRYPYGLMFAVLSEEGTNTVLPQGRQVIEGWLAKLGSIVQITNVEASDIPAERLGPGMTFGKAVNATLTRGLRARANLYSQTVDGRKLLVGFATITGETVPAGYENLLTSDPEADAQEFFEMAASLKGGTPWGPNTPGERRP
jgi:hypothetical protein